MSGNCKITPPADTNCLTNSVKHSHPTSKPRCCWNDGPWTYPGRYSMVDMAVDQHQYRADGSSINGKSLTARPGHCSGRSRDTTYTDPGSVGIWQNFACGCLSNGTPVPKAFTIGIRSSENREDQMLTTRPDHGLRSRYNPDTKNPVLEIHECRACGSQFVPRMSFQLHRTFTGPSRLPVHITIPSQHCEPCGGGDLGRWGLRRKIKLAAYEWMKSRPCVDCRQVFTPAAMEFDHKPGYEKVGQLSDIVHKVGLRRFVDEIAKCDVVCANCHRVRTEQRRSNAEA